MTKPASAGVLASLEQALTDVLPSLQPRDLALVELARTIALHIDCGDDLGKLGPQLAAVLDALLMSPKSRAAAAGKGAPKDDPRATALDELRQRRSARINGTAAVDAAAP